MGTLVQAFVAKTEERANKLNSDICNAFKGSGQFEDNRLVVSPVTPIYDQDISETKAYGFYVYFDSVEFGDDIKADILVDRHGTAREED